MRGYFQGQVQLRGSCATENLPQHGRHRNAGTLDLPTAHYSTCRQFTRLESVSFRQIGWATFLPAVLIVYLFWGVGWEGGASSFDWF